MNAEQNGPMRVEDEIDAALKVLGETRPPAQIVSRVHRRLQTAAASQPARSGRRFLIPAAGAATVALAWLALSIPMQRTQTDQFSAVPTARLATTTQLPRATVAAPIATVETERAEEGKRSVQFYTERRSRPNHGRRHAINLLSYPLTQQEKLLLQFAHTAKPADLQALNPEYQAKVEAQQDAEFAAYVNSGSGTSTKETAN